MRLSYTSVEIPCKETSTLAWWGKDLIDTTSDQVLKLDGSFSRRTFSQGYPFDRGLCVEAAGSVWTVAYDNRGTKAGLLKNGKLQRELNRSYYCAKAYDYPIALLRTAAQRVVVIHCPNFYNVVEFEDADTGEMLGKKESDGMEFHSRLAVSHGGGHLLSAGWFWHPICGAWLCSLDRETGIPAQDADELSFSFGSEIDSAAFLGSDRLVVSTTEEVVNDDIPPAGLGPMRLAVWSIPEHKWESVVEIEQTSGIIMPWRDWVISFYDHPKAIEISTGRVVHEWEQICSGRQVGAIDLGEPAPPPIALDPEHGRFAVAGPAGVTVIALEAVS